MKGGDTMKVIVNSNLKKIKLLLYLLLIISIFGIDQGDRLLFCGKENLESPLIFSLSMSIRIVRDIPQGPERFLTGEPDIDGQLKLILPGLVPSDWSTMQLSMERMKVVERLLRIAESDTVKKDKIRLAATDILLDAPKTEDYIIPRHFMVQILGAITDSRDVEVLEKVLMDSESQRVEAPLSIDKPNKGALPTYTCLALKNIALNNSEVKVKVVNILQQYIDELYWDGSDEHRDELYQEWGRAWPISKFVAIMIKKELTGEIPLPPNFELRSFRHYHRWVTYYQNLYIDQMRRQGGG